MTENNIKIKKEIIYNAVMDGWKVKKLKTNKIELTKTKNANNENIDLEKVIKELIETH